MKCLCDMLSGTWAPHQFFQEVRKSSTAEKQWLLHPRDCQEPFCWWQCIHGSVDPHVLRYACGDTQCPLVGSLLLPLHSFQGQTQMVRLRQAFLLPEPAHQPQHLLESALFNMTSRIQSLDPRPRRLSNPLASRYEGPNKYPA